MQNQSAVIGVRSEHRCSKKIMKKKKTYLNLLNIIINMTQCMLSILNF